MTKTLSTIGTLLVLAGVALLAYVGWTYAHQNAVATGTTGKWGSRDRNQGQEIAQQLRGAQRVTIPSALKGQPRPVPGAEPATRMLIPKIGVDAPVVQTTPVNGVWEVADWAVGHLSTTPNPGAAGNAAYSAHDDIKGEIFKRVGELRPGDAIVLRTAHARYTYII